MSGILGGIKTTLGGIGTTLSSKGAKMALGGLGMAYGAMKITHGLARMASDGLPKAMNNFAGIQSPIVQGRKLGFDSPTQLLQSTNTAVSAMNYRRRRML